MVSEFRAKTGRNYYQLRSHELLKRAGVLDVSVSKDNLQEEEELYAARANLALATAFASDERSARAVAALRANMSELNTVAFSESTRDSLAAAVRGLSPVIPASVLGAIAAEMRNLPPVVPRAFSGTSQRPCATFPTTRLKRPTQNPRVKTLTTTRTPLPMATSSVPTNR
ncbi:hypothetical protein NKG05_30870 [Oerskovia sp. M15]